MFDDRRLFIPDKVRYIRAKHYSSDDRCILCELVEGNEDLINLIVMEYNDIFITLNLYPYNPGHLMIFPKRHIEDLRDLSKDEIDVISQLTTHSLNILDEHYQPRGYNIGYNIGEFSGASISHIHRHIIPRYRNELGVLDILSGTRIIVDDMVKSRDILREAFHERLR